MRHEALRLQFDPSEIITLAERYDWQNDKPALEAGSRIARGDYSGDNLRAIFRWKTKGRGASRLNVNTEAEIAEALSIAAQARHERTAVAVLVGLTGIDVPVASAVLTATYPERFTIIDFRALESLGSATTDRSISFYLIYLSRCRELSAAHKVALRDLDRALWQWSRENSKSDAR